MNSNTLLEVRGLTKIFPGVRALDDVEFTLQEGSVHAVCGENGAGKSTLMNILMGLYQKDAGEIWFNGKSVNYVSPKQALRNGIAIIEQELNPVIEMTVAENMFLGREDVKGRLFVDYKKLEARAKEALNILEINIDPSTKMKHLSLAQIQLVEIAKAISYDSKIIIMDEPTSALGEKDTEILFKIINKMKSQGKGIIYVSHRMKEIFTISDTITVFRDGRYISTHPTKDITRSDLISLMIGRKLEEEFVKTNKVTDEIAIEITNYSKENVFDNISFNGNKGEIVGIFGLMGSGRSEFFHALFGIDPIDSGVLHLFGKKVEIHTPNQAKKHHIAYVTEDRKVSGLVLKSSVLENISLPNLKRFSKGIFINSKFEKNNITKIANQLRVKTPSLKQLVSRLSGGNQQKVVLSKWLLTEPNILLLDEPTRGIDVGAKRELYSFMSNFANQGNCVIMISSELPEVMGMSDKIVVFKEGKSIAVRERKDFNQDDLMSLASDGIKEKIV
jgi:ABC-type sugar transport system ATPase subunit